MPSALLLLYERAQETSAEQLSDQNVTRIGQNTRLSRKILLSLSKPQP